MNYKSIATEVLKNVGGEGNVANLEHCSTRLRFSVVDESKVNEEALKKIEGVIGVIINAQVQVVIGGAVIEVYDELMKMYKPNNTLQTSGSNKGIGATILDYIVGIFQPLVPAIAGAGVLKSVLILLSTFGVVSKTSGLFVILSSISDATFYFLPLMVAVTTSTKLKTNKLVALAAVGVMLLPNNVALLASEEGLSILGFAVKNVVYNSQVFPAILTVFFLAAIEKGMTKISPKAVRIFFVPMVSLAITIPIALLILGPLGYTMGEYLTTAILFLYDKLGFVGVAILSGILPFMIATGMHKAMVPYAVDTYSKIGYEIMYLPASLAHNISEAGATLAVALKAKDVQLKSTAASASISALMGITEPALYGVTLQHKKVLLSVVLSSFITGGFAGYVLLKSFVIVGPGLANITMFIDPDNGMNIVYAIIAFVMAFILSFIFSFIFWKEDTSMIEEKNANVDKFYEVIEGDRIGLEDVKDEMFSKKTLGEGYAIIPSNNVVVAPLDGVVKMVFDTKHAIGLESENGSEVLIHIGINTVELNGQHFETCVKVGDVVKKGDVLVKFEKEKIEEMGYDLTTPIVITNSADYDVNVNIVQDAVITTKRRA